MIFQFLVGAVVLYSVTMIFLRLKQRSITAVQAAFWLFFWALASIVVFYPGIVNRIADIIGVGRGADVVVYVSILSLFVLFFKLFIKVRQSEQRLTHFVRKQAISQGVLMYKEKTDSSS